LPSPEVLFRRFRFYYFGFEEAIKWLPSTQKIKSYPTIWAAKTLLADVYLTMAGWPLKTN
jgi:hypothetical protein